MTEKILVHNPEGKTRMVKLGSRIFEIPAHMSIADMAEVWQNHSDSMEAAAWAIVEFAPRFATEIVHQWVEKHNCYLVPREEYDNNNAYKRP